MLQISLLFIKINKHREKMELPSFENVAMLATPDVGLRADAWFHPFPGRLWHAKATKLTPTQAELKFFDDLPRHREGLINFKLLDYQGVFHRVTMMARLSEMVLTRGGVWRTFAKLEATEDKGDRQLLQFMQAKQSGRRSSVGAGLVAVN